MKITLFNYFLSLSLSCLFFTGCGNANSENHSSNDNATEEIDMTTQIEGFLPPVMSFYEVDLQEDGQTVISDSESTFNITKDKEVYWAKWKYEAGEEVEKIQLITEKTPGSAYELKTQSSGGSTIYTISKVNEDGVWVMTNSNNDHFGYLRDKNAVLSKI